MEQMSTVESATPQQSVKGLSFKGIFQVFYEPVAFFSQLRDNPRVLVAWIVIFLIFFAFTWITADISQKDRVELMRNSQLLQGQQIPTDTSTASKLIGATFGALMMAFLPALIISALALLIGNFFMGGAARFKQVLSVVLYGSMISCLGELIKIPLILAKGSSYVTLSFATLIPSLEVTSPWWVLLSSFGFFQIWEMVAVGIGFACIYGFSRNKGYTVSVLSIGTFLVIGALLAILAMSFIL